MRRQVIRGGRRSVVYFNIRRLPGEKQTMSKYHCRMQPLVDARVGVGSKKGTHDVQAEKGKCIEHRCPVGARRRCASQATTE